MSGKVISPVRSVRYLLNSKLKTSGIIINQFMFRKKWRNELGHITWGCKSAPGCPASAVTKDDPPKIIRFRLNHSHKLPLCKKRQGCSTLNLGKRSKKSFWGAKTSSPRTASPLSTKEELDSGKENVAANDRKLPEKSKKGKKVIFISKHDMNALLMSNSFYVDESFDVQVTNER